MSYSTFNKRLSAYSIDCLITGAVNFAISFLIGNETASFILSAIFVMAYYIICEGGEHHATIGKRKMGIMVVDESGKGIGYETAAKRHLGRLLSNLTFYIGYLIANKNDKCQTLHDMIAKTYVVDVASVSNTNFVTAKLVEEI